jgi:hypothetical protein
MKRNLILILIAYFFFVVGYAQQTITPETALKSYLNNNDPTWGWEISDEYQIDHGFVQ